MGYMPVQAKMPNPKLPNPATVISRWSRRWHQVRFDRLLEKRMGVEEQINRVEIQRSILRDIQQKRAEEGEALLAFRTETIWARLHLVTGVAVKLGVFAIGFGAIMNNFVEIRGWIEGWVVGWGLITGLTGHSIWKAPASPNCLKVVDGYLQDTLQDLQREHRRIVEKITPAG